MTMMPDVWAKTRICAGLDDTMNEPDVNIIWWKWYEDLVNTHYYMAGNLIDDMPLSKSEGGKWADASGPIKSDKEHIKTHVLGDGGAPWWDAETHAVATEAFARAIWLQWYQMKYHKTKIYKRPGDKRLPIEFWWTCPATHVFRIVLLESPDRITCIISTPPKIEHTAHYEAYNERRNDPRLLPKEWPVPPLKKLENILIISPSKDAVIYGTSQSTGQKVPVAQEWGRLTGAKAANVVTTQPKCEDY